MTETLDIANRIALENCELLEERAVMLADIKKLREAADAVYSRMVAAGLGISGQGVALVEALSQTEKYEEVNVPN